MPNPPLSEEERKRRKQVLSRERSRADVYRRSLEKEESLMDKLTEDQRVEQRRLIARRGSERSARACRERTTLDLRSELKAATKKAKAACAQQAACLQPQPSQERRDARLRVASVALCSRRRVDFRDAATALVADG